MGSTFNAVVELKDGTHIEINTESIDELKKNIKDLKALDNPTESTTKKESSDQIQMDLGCCGDCGCNRVDSDKDYLKS